jgi:hypothetical protein
MINFYNIFIRSILAGICIELGGAIFIKLGGVLVLVFCIWVSFGGSFQITSLNRYCWIY